MHKNILITIIPISISILLYWNYINAPYGTYDIWFDRIAFGGYEFSELPESFKSLNIPTDLESYIKYRVQYTGRTPGSTIISYLGFYFFRDNPTAWRVFIFIIMFLTYYFICLILRKLRFKDYIIILTLIMFPALLSMYFVKIIYFPYAISHLFFLIVLYLELNNSSDKSFNYWKSILGALLIFGSIFIRELQVTAAFGLALILILWYNYITEQIEFKINFKRILPYIISAVLYLVFFYGILSYFGKYEFAYANAVAFNLDLQYYKRSLLFIINYIGLSVSAYFGCLVLIIIFACFIILKFRTKNNCNRLTNFENFKILFGLSVIIPTGFLISFLTHVTGAFTIHVLASFILLATFMQYFLNCVRSNLPRIFFTLFFIILSIFRLMEAKQENHYYIVQANVIQKISKILLMNATENEVVQLSGFSLDEAYSLVAEVFINNGRMEFYSDDIEVGKNPYLNYRQSGIINYHNYSPTIRIVKTYDLNYNKNKGIWIMQGTQKRFLLNEIIKNKDSINPALDFIHKTFFGYSFGTRINNSKIAAYHIIM